MSEIFDVLSLLERKVDEIEQRRVLLTDVQRSTILSTIRSLSNRIESPYDTQQRVQFWPIDAGVTRACMELGVFAELVNADQPMPLEALASRTGAEPVLLRRLLRHQASVAHVVETAVDIFEANNVTANLTATIVEATILFSYEVGGPAGLTLSKFLAERSWTNPQDPSDTPFHASAGTKLSFWDYLQQNKVLSKQFQLNMESHRTITGSCFDDYDVWTELQSCDSGRAVFVDVGGGAGGQCMDLLQKYPDIQGRIILQDLADTVDTVDLPERIETMAHDFFTVQPLRGAKVYFLRAVLHDHPDDKATEILARIADVMAPDSVLILNELVVPGTHAPSLVTQSDILMMLYVAAAERTEAQWEALLEHAGLRLISCDHNPRGLGVSLLKAIKR